MSIRELESKLQKSDDVMMDGTMYRVVWVSDSEVCLSIECVESLVYKYLTFDELLKKEVRFYKMVEI